MLPVLDDFIAIVNITLLAIPASVTVALGALCVEPQVRRSPDVYFLAGYVMVGLVATEIIIRVLSRTRHQSGQFLYWSPAQWATYSRIAQIVGLACVLLVYFGMR